MTDEDLKKYLPCKGDRIAAKAFARGEEIKILRMKEKSTLIESLRKRMGDPSSSIVSVTEEQGVKISIKNQYTIPK